MTALSHWLHLVSWTCLLACRFVRGASEASDFKTGIAEFDLVFPRNETYSPSIVFPAVVALQSPAVARSMNPSIGFNIWRKNGTDWEGVKSGSGNISGLANASDSEPFLVHEVFGGIFNVEASWYITWQLLWLNCFEQDGRIESQGNTTSGRVYFTTKQGGSQPDLVAATEGDGCAKAEAQTFNVTEIVEAPADPGALFPVESCAVFSQATPTADPCAVKVNSATAESIAASATYTVCHWVDPPEGLDCPDEDRESIGEKLKVAGVASVATFIGVGYLLL